MTPVIWNMSKALIIDSNSALLIERFHSLEEKKAFAEEKSSTSTGLSYYTNMAAVSSFWNTNMAAVTSCENAL